MNTRKAGKIAGVSFVAFIATAFAATKIDLSPAASQLAGFVGAFLGSLVANGRRGKRRTRMTEVKVYGTDWCEDTQRVRSRLDDLRVPYRYIDIEADERAAAWVRHQNDGKEKKPTVDIGGIILLAPGNLELEEALKDAQLLPG